jgi:hypothetical protein
MRWRCWQELVAGAGQRSKPRVHQTDTGPTISRNSLQRNTLQPTTAHVLGKVRCEPRLGEPTVCWARPSSDPNSLQQESLQQHTHQLDKPLEG